MQKKQPAFFLTLIILLLLLTAGAVVLAQTSAGFNLEWHVIGNGGGESSSASYHVNGTIGQGVASQPGASSASFVVSSGYWFGDIGTMIYLPITVRN